MNLIRNIPKKLGCSRFLKEDEKLFIHGLKKYQERIQFANFLNNLKKINKDAVQTRLEIDSIKSEIKMLKEQHRNRNSREQVINRLQRHRP